MESSSLARRAGRALEELVADQRIGWVGAHPDDETLEAGGLLAMFAYLGIPVHCLALTAGQRGIPGMALEEAGIVRMEEMRAACDVLGVRSAETLSRMDTKLVCAPDLEEEIADWASGHGLTMVLTHHFRDYHRDHRVASEAVNNSQALFTGARPLVVMVDTLKGAECGDPELIVNTSRWFDLKMAAAACYATQMQGGQLKRYSRVMSEQRAISMRGAQAAEGVWGAGMYKQASLDRMSLLQFAANV